MSDITFSPFFNDHTKDLFHKLVLPQINNSSNLNKTFLSGFSKTNDSVEKSFIESEIDINNHFFKEVYNLLPPICDNKPFKTLDIISSRKIRIFPSKEEISFYNKCFGATRFFYNETIYRIKNEYNNKFKVFSKNANRFGCLYPIINSKTKIIKNSKTLKSSKSKTLKGSKTKTLKGSKTAKTSLVKNKNYCCQKLSNKFFCTKHLKHKLKYNISLSFRYWRDIIVKSKIKLNDNEQWQLEIPCDTKQLAVKTAVANYKAALTNRIKGNIKSFDFKFKSKKQPNQYFHIDSRALTNKLILWKTLLNAKLKMNKKDSIWLKSHMKSAKKIRSMQILREWPSKYYLIVPFDKDKKIIKTKKSIVSIDPGVRTFHTFYDPRGNYGKIGIGLSTSLNKLNKKLDKYISLSDNLKNLKKDYKKEKIKKKIKKIKENNKKY